MRASRTFHVTVAVARVALALGLAAGSGCSGGAGALKPPPTGAAGAVTGAAGVTTGAAGAAAGVGGAATGAAGQAPDAADGAGALDASADEGSGEAGTGAAGAGAAGAAGAGAAGTGATVDVTKVRPSQGCGVAAPADLVPGQLVARHIMTMGIKDAGCADAKCGAWTDTRDYWVKLPTGYDNTKAYPLVFEGPGCGGQGNNLYTIPAFDSTVIRVGLSPSAYWQQYHATNPGQHCFDDKEGDDSVDWVFYEDLYDLFDTTLCFDRDRVFAGGNSSGAWLANELGCKYAGDAKHPIRGVLVNQGGLPTDPKYVPTCSGKPLAGVWIDAVGDFTDTINYDIYAINHALGTNGCGVTYSTAAYDDFPIGPTSPALTCKTVRGCPALDPVVVCPVSSVTHDAHQEVAIPAFATFVKMFSAPPFVTP